LSDQPNSQENSLENSLLDDIVRTDNVQPQDLLATLTNQQQVQSIESNSTFIPVIEPTSMNILTTELTLTSTPMTKVNKEFIYIPIKFSDLRLASDNFFLKF